MAPALERRLPTLPPGPIAFQLRFPDISEYSDELALAGKPPSPPSVATDDGQVSIDCPAAYLHGFANAVNIADRFMIAALARAAYALANVQVDDITVDVLVQEIVHNDDARFLHMIPAKTLREMIQAALPVSRPRLLTPEDRAWSRLNLARVAGWSDPPGEVPANQAGPLLNNAVAAIWNRIEEKLLTLSRVRLIQRALLNHDAIEHDRAQWRMTAAALLSLYDNTADIVQAANDREGQRGLAALSSRVIAEMALCTSPLDGGFDCSGADLDFLIAETAILLDCAGQSDALHHGLVTRQPVVHANGSFGFDRSFGESLQRPYMEAHGERIFRAAAANYGSAFDRDESIGEIDSDFDAAFATEFGLGLENLFEFAAQSVSVALDRRSPHYQIPKTDVLRQLSSVGASDPNRTFHALSLTPRPKWDEDKPKGAMKRDWYPWRYNRRLSLTRRPLVQLSTGPDPEVLIVPTLIDRTIRYLCEAVTGRLPIDLFDSQPMRRWIGGAVNRGGHDFNQKVAAQISQLGYKVRPELKLTTLGGSAQLGDIDVLAWHPDSDVIYAIECKRLLFARTVGEIGERLTEYTSTVESGSDRTPIQKHLDRIAYLKANLVQLTSITSIPADRAQLRSALVTDYLVPMQFSKHALGMIDLVTDYALLSDAFR